MIKSNTNIIQRSVRFILGIILLLAGLLRFGALNSNWFGIVLVVASLFPLAISITGYCPLCNKKESSEIE